jgi:serine/threonine protein kinase
MKSRGVQHDWPSLETYCGSPLYSAPEVYLCQVYTPAVDLWSLGVMILESVYGLPEEAIKLSNYNVGRPT